MYRKFIPNSTNIITTTYGSYSVIFFKKKKIQWRAAQEISFQNLTKAVTAYPILKLLNLSQVFILQTNASDRGLGAFLLQEDVDKNNQPSSYISRKLNKAEENYSTIEREFLAVVLAIQKFYKYLHGRELFKKTNHQPLVYLNSSKLLNSRFLHYSLELQPYTFRIVSIRGRGNVGADFLGSLWFPVNTDTNKKGLLRSYVNR